MDKATQIKAMFNEYAKSDDMKIEELEQSVLALVSEDTEENIDKPKTYLLITKNDTDDYEYWVTNDINDESTGYSTRGLRSDVMAEIKETLEDF